MDPETDRLFLAEAIKQGLLYRYSDDLNGAKFSFYTNSVGTIHTTTDPFKIAQMLLLCASYNRPGYGLQNGLMSLMARDINDELKKGDRCHLFWDYYHPDVPASRLVSLGGWVLAQIQKKAKTPEELDIMVRFQSLMCK